MESQRDDYVAAEWRVTLPVFSFENSKIGHREALNERNLYIETLYQVQEALLWMDRDFVNMCIMKARDKVPDLKLISLEYVKIFLLLESFCCLTKYAKVCKEPVPSSSLGLSNAFPFPAF